MPKCLEIHYEIGTIIGCFRFRSPMGPLMGFSYRAYFVVFYRKTKPIYFTPEESRNLVTGNLRYNDDICVVTNGRLADRLQ